jgi:hypothetical protein
VLLVTKQSLYFVWKNKVHKQISSILPEGEPRWWHKHIYLKPRACTVQNVRYQVRGSRTYQLCPKRKISRALSCTYMICSIWTQESSQSCAKGCAEVSRWELTLGWQYLMDELDSTERYQELYLTRERESCTKLCTWSKRVTPRAVPDLRERCQRLFLI